MKSIRVANRPYERIIDDNVCNMRVANTGGQIVARLTLGGVDYHGTGQTVAAALFDLDADIASSAKDCDCVLPGHRCSTCCPKNMATDEEIFF